MYGLAMIAPVARLNIRQILMRWSTKWFSRLIYFHNYLNLFRSCKKNKLKNFRIFCQNIVRSKKVELYLNLWRMKKKFWPFRDCFRSLLQVSRLELASLVVLHSVPRYHVSVFSKKFLLSTAHWSGIKIVFSKSIKSKTFGVSKID